MDVDGEKATGEEPPPTANGSASPPAADGAPAPTPAAPTENGGTPPEAETKAEEAPKKKVYSKVRRGRAGQEACCGVIHGAVSRVTDGRRVERAWRGAGSSCPR